MKPRRRRRRRRQRERRKHNWFRPRLHGLDKCFNGQIFSRASRLHGAVQIPLQIAALFALQKLMQGLAGPL